MPWDSFKSVASGRVGKNQLWQQATEALILEKANELLSEILSFEPEHLAQAVYLKNKTLTIAVLSEKILAQLEQKQEELIQKINQEFETEVVLDLYFLK